MFFFGICTLYNQFRCCMPMYGPMHLVLYHFKKLPGSLGIFIAIKRCSIEIRNLFDKTCAQIVVSHEYFPADVQNIHQ